MKRTAVSRADLLDALVFAERGGGLSVTLLGFERPEAPKLPPGPEIEHDHGGTTPPPKTAANGEPPPRTEYPKPQPGQRALQFLLPTEREVLRAEPLAPEERLPALTDEEISMPAPCEQVLVPLAPWSRLAPFLRRRLGRMVASHRLDLRRLARQLASGLPWRRLPRLIRPSWGTATVVLWDTSPEMDPYQPDVAELVRRLKRERGRHGLKVSQCFGPPATLRLEPGIPVLALSALGQLQPDAEVRHGWLRCGNALRTAGHRLTALVPAPAGRWHPALAACFPAAAWDRWQRLPRRAAARTPFAGFQASPATGSPEGAERLTLLLDLLAPASRITPGLLRRIRLLLGPAADAALEHDAWFHPDTTGSEGGRYFGFREGSAYELRLQRLRLRSAEPATADLVRRAAALIREEHRRHCSPLVTLAADCRTLLGLDFAAEELDGGLQLLGRAVERLRELAQTPGNSAGHRSGLPAWFCRFVEHGLSPALRAHPAIAERVAQGLALARKFLDDSTAAWPTGVLVTAALAEIRRSNGTRRPPTTYRVDVVEQGLRFSAPPQTVPKLSLARILAGEPLAHVVFGDGQKMAGVPVRLGPLSVVPGELPSKLVIESDWERVRMATMSRPFWAKRWFCNRSGATAEVELADGTHVFRWGTKLRFQWAEAELVLDEEESTRLVVGVRKFEWIPISKPSWASRLWADEFGVAAEFLVGAVPFVLRWIPPGRFFMGSPDDEPGRWDAEGPQHEVTISRGFWLGETPVTQAQWRAVVEATPPAGDLLRSLGIKRNQGLNPSPSDFKGPGDLPVESVTWDESGQFCRLFNALLKDGPGLRLPSEAEWEYACRAGATTAFYDGSPCIQPEGQAPALDRLGWFDQNSGGKSQPVKQKQPNDWGLYDTLGNVWEWCADAWGNYTAEAQRDPVRDGREDAPRVVRGGSWGGLARYCRAAYRAGWLRGYRIRYLGFRLAAAPELRAAEPRLGAERPSRRGGAGAEGRSPEDQPTAKRWW